MRGDQGQAVSHHNAYRCRQGGQCCWLGAAGCAASRPQGHHTAHWWCWWGVPQATRTKPACSSSQWPHAAPPPPLPRRPRPPQSATPTLALPARRHSAAPQQRATGACCAAPGLPPLHARCPDAPPTSPRPIHFMRSHREGRPAARHTATGGPAAGLDERRHPPNDPPTTSRRAPARCRAVAWQSPRRRAQPCASPVTRTHCMHDAGR